MAWLSRECEDREFGQGAMPGILVNHMGVELDMSGISQFLNVPGLHGLNEDEKDRIAYFLKSPGKGEFFFLLQILGKTPSQIRNTMIEDFIRRFDLLAHADGIREAFPSKRSWRALDAAVAEFAGSLDVAEHLHFWDKMRYVLEAKGQWG